MNKLILSLCFIFSLSSFAQIKALTKIEGKNIYACFNEVDTEKEKSFIVVVRNSDLITDSWVVNSKENKNSVLAITMYQSDIRSSFGVAPLQHEGKTKLTGPNEGWDPALQEETLFTARGNLKAITIQASNKFFTPAEFIEFGSKSQSLICTSNEELAKELIVKAFESDPFKL